MVRHQRTLMRKAARSLARDRVNLEDEVGSPALTGLNSRISQHLAHMAYHMREGRSIADIPPDILEGILQDFVAANHPLAREFHTKFLRTQKRNLNVVVPQRAAAPNKFTDAISPSYSLSAYLPHRAALPPTGMGLAVYRDRSTTARLSPGQALTAQGIDPKTMRSVRTGARMVMGGSKRRIPYRPQFLFMPPRQVTEMQHSNLIPPFMKSGPQPQQFIPERARLQYGDYNHPLPPGTVATRVRPPPGSDVNLGRVEAALEATGKVPPTGQRRIPYRPQFLFMPPRQVDEMRYGNLIPPNMRGAPDPMRYIPQRARLNYGDYNHPMPPSSSESESIDSQPEPTTSADSMNLDSEPAGDDIVRQVKDRVMSRIGQFDMEKAVDNISAINALLRERKRDAEATRVLKEARQALENRIRELEDADAAEVKATRKRRVGEPQNKVNEVPFELELESKKPRTVRVKVPYTIDEGPVSVVDSPYRINRGDPKNPSPFQPVTVELKRPDVKSPETPTVTIHPRRDDVRAARRSERQIPMGSLDPESLDDAIADLDDLDKELQDDKKKRRGTAGARASPNPKSSPSRADIMAGIRSSPLFGASMSDKGPSSRTRSKDK